MLTAQRARTHGCVAYKPVHAMSPVPSWCPRRSDRVAAQEDFAYIRQYFVDPIQHDYEVIRPIVLFAETAAERSRALPVTALDIVHIIRYTRSLH
jgi:hypothetical protein